MSVDSQIKELVQETREWVEDQVEQLSEQVQQLQKQTRQLRKTMRREVRKRRKYWNRLRRSMPSLTKNLQKRRENLTERLMQRGGKITQNVLDFGGKTTQDLAERSGKFTQELAKRGERLLEPVRKRDRTFWSIVGFGIGLLTAGIITYQLVRRRVAQQETGQDEHIELPQSNSWDGSGGRPVGEISYIDQGGTSVATLEIVDVKTVEQSADAAFVGVKSTKLYYSVDTELEPEDLVYFTTEEEAKAQGFTAGE
jgi:hypothetical protein